MDEQPDQTGNQPDSWVAATDRFETAADDLGDLYAPQLKALHHLAEQLDAADAEPPALVAEYSRVHRWLLNKIIGGKTGAAEEPAYPGSMLPGLEWLE